MQDYDWQEALDYAVAPGDIIAGRYRIDGAIGAGGMGVVLKAWHLVFDARVAIKVLLPERVANAEARARFDREARATFQIRSEHVPRVHDIGTLEAGLPYIVMEYLRGRTLSRLVKDKGRFEVSTAVDYILQACDAVAEAHALGIVHRDLKPANLLVTHRANGSACIKVLDFGLAKAGYHKGSLTTVHRSMGTPRYMSPEQWLSARDAGPPTDIWALGATLFEMLTGSAPFTADQIDVLCQMVLQSSPPALTTLRPTAPSKLEAVVATCLQRNPRHRFRSVATLARSLAEFAPPMSRTLPTADVRQAVATSHVVDSQQVANAQWGYDAEPPPAALPDRTVHDAHERAPALQVEEGTTAQIAHRYGHPEGHGDAESPPPAWAPGAEPAPAEDFAPPPYDPNGAGRAGATMVDAAPPGGMAEDPVIEWSEDDAVGGAKATKVLPVDQEARTQRLRREDARKLLDLPVKRKRRKTQTVRKVIGLLLLAVAGFLGGAALTKIIRDLHQSGAASEVGPAGADGAAAPPWDPTAPPPLPALPATDDRPASGAAGGTVYDLDEEEDGGLQVDASAAAPTSAEPDRRKPARRKRSRRRRPSARVARSTRAAGHALSDSWQTLRDQL